MTDWAAARCKTILGGGAGNGSTLCPSEETPPDEIRRGEMPRVVHVLLASPPEKGWDFILATR
jgi:hypothetical protein